MKARNRVMGWLARNAPALNTIQIAAMRRDAGQPGAGGSAALRRDLAAMPKACDAR